MELTNKQLKELQFVKIHQKDCSTFYIQIQQGGGMEDLYLSFSREIKIDLSDNGAVIDLTGQATIWTGISFDGKDFKDFEHLKNFLEMFQP